MSCRVLVIGDGPSALNLFKRPAEHWSAYDYVVGCNNSIRFFRQYITHHIVLETEPRQLMEFMQKNPLESHITPIRHAHYAKSSWAPHPLLQALHRLKKPHRFNPLKIIKNLNEKVASPDGVVYDGLVFSMDGRADTTIALQAMHYATILAGKNGTVEYIGFEGRFQNINHSHSYGKVNYDDIYYDEEIRAYTRPLWRYTTKQLNLFIKHARGYGVNIKEVQCPE